jgi:hypothetical protein
MPLMVSNGGVLAVVLAVFQQKGGYTRVMLQNPNEFRPAIAAMSDDADVGRQVFDYSFL